MLGATSGFALSQQVNAGTPTAVILTILLAALFVQAQTLSNAFVSLMSGTVLMSILVLFLDRLPLTSGVPIWIVFLLHVISIGCVVRVLNSSKISKVELASETFSGAIVLGGAIALFARWPLENALSYLSFLSYEDNAGWISTASSFSKNHVGAYSDQAGGYVLDPLMSSLHFISTTIQSGTVEPSHSYQLVGSSYVVIEFLAVMSVGLMTLRATRLLTTRVGAATRAVFGLGGMGLAYVACQLPRTTGHLTFIGGLAFVWSMGCVAGQSQISSPTDARRQALTQGLLLVGAVGMWWPLGIVALLVASKRILMSARQVKDVVLHSMSRFRVGAVVFVGLVAGLVLLVPISTGFRSMSFREFFTVKGGVQPPPGNSVFIAIFVFLVLWAVVLGDVSVSQKWKSFRAIYDTIAMIGVLTAMLYLVSYFVGPEFAQNYTTQKTLLFFVLLLVPMCGVAMIAISDSWSAKFVPSAAFASFFMIGFLTVGWNLNDPRTSNPPDWGSTLLTTADANPNAIILCTTSDPARNMDAYLCSRHAAALQMAEGVLTQTWRHLQVFPQQNSAPDQERVILLRDEISSQLSEGVGVIVLPLEVEFAIADEDLWWMNQLPLAKMTIAMR